MVPARRAWPSRIIDGVIVALLTGVVFGIQLAGGTGTSAAVVTALLVYILVTVILGMLYGWGIGIGQLLTGMISRRTSDGRRVGAFRGAMRYLGVAFAPLLLAAALTGGDAPSFWNDDVAVTPR